MGCFLFLIIYSLHFIFFTVNLHKRADKDIATLLFYFLYLYNNIISLFYYIIIIIIIIIIYI